MKKGDTVTVVSNFDAPEQETVPQGIITRLCAINEYDKLGTIDLGDRMAVIPLTLLRVHQTKKERESLIHDLTEEVSAPKRIMDLSHIQHSVNKGLRFNQGKPKLHRVPYELIKGAAEGFEYGASKYPDWNWTKPIEFSSPYDSLMRHLNAWWWEGEDIDKESQVHHLKLAAANIAILLFHLQNNPNMDDRRKKNE